MHNLTAEWKYFHSGTRKAEGRLIHAPQDSGDLILFCPGFPGAGSSLFEQRFVEAFCIEEYAQVYLRHNGTRLDSSTADEMLNTRQFPKAIPFHDGEWIGGAPSSVAEWLAEPQTVIEDFGAEYTGITVLAHSFGAVAALHSLANLHEAGHSILERVRKVICLAPAVGLLKDHADDVMDTLWVSEFLADSSVTDRVTLNGVDAIRSDLKATYQTLAARVKNLPAHIEKIFVHVERDEYIRGHDVEEFAQSVGENTQFLMDPFDRHDPRLIYAAHDMPNYPIQTLLDLVEGTDVPVVVRGLDGFDE